MEVLGGWGQWHKLQRKIMQHAEVQLFTYSDNVLFLPIARGHDLSRMKRSVLSACFGRIHDCLRQQFLSSLMRPLLPLCGIGHLAQLEYS